VRGAGAGFVLSEGTLLEEDADERASDSPPQIQIRRGVIASVLAGAVAAAVVVAFAGSSAILAQMRQLPYGWLALAAGLNVLAWAFQGVGLAALSSSGVWVNAGKMTRAFLGGDLVANVTPFGAGGVVAGIYCVNREGPSAGEATAVITLHSMLTGAYFAVVGLLAVATLPAQRLGTEILLGVSILALALGSVVVLWLVRNPSHVAVWLGRWADGVAARWLLGADRSQRLATTARAEARRFSVAVDDLVRDRPLRLVASFAAVCLSRALVAASLLAVLTGFGWTGPALPVLFLSVGAMALAIVTPVPGGSGVTEIVTVALLAPHMSRSLAGASTLVWRGVSFYAELLVGGAVFAYYLMTHGVGSIKHR
jgi:uncharacterized protein (TIRG00374 family)